MQSRSQSARLLRATQPDLHTCHEEEGLQETKRGGPSNRLIGWLACLDRICYRLRQPDSCAGDCTANRRMIPRPDASSGQ
jgi:hypothetical protein